MLAPPPSLVLTVLVSLFTVCTRRVASQTQAWPIWVQKSAATETAKHLFSLDSLPGSSLTMYPSALQLFHWEKTLRLVFSVPKTTVISMQISGAVKMDPSCC